MTQIQIRTEIAKIESKIFNLQQKANNLDDKMETHWDFNEEAQAQRVWSRIHRCNNKILELTVKKNDLYKQLG